MRNGVMRISLLSLLVGALVLPGCERTGPTEVPSAPQFSQGREHKLHKVARRAHGAKSGEARAVIGRKGGVVVLGEHRLVVPAGAVARPTRFSMRLVGSAHVEVDLRATTLGSKGRENDVGERGFARPVTLHLGYGEVDEAVDPNRLVIVWVRPDGTLEPQTSTWDRQAQAISAALRHFSPYALASD